MFHAQEIVCALVLKKIAQPPIRTQNFNLEMAKLNIIFTETNGSRHMVFSNSFHTIHLAVSTKLLTTTCLNVCKRTQLLLCSSQVKTHANNDVMLLLRS